MWWWIAAAWAVEAEGFHRLWERPERLAVHPTAPAPAEPDRAPNAGVLILENPFTVLVDARVGDLLVGALAPRASGALIGVPEGDYTVTFTPRHGAALSLRVATVRQPPHRPGLPSPTLPALPPPTAAPRPGSSRPSPQ
jgi:hypothetical protein